MRTALRRFSILAFFGLGPLAGLSGLWLAGCGGSTEGPPLPVRTLVGQGNFTLRGVPGALALGVPFDAFRQELTLGSPGTLEVIVDWTSALNDIDFIVYRGTCSFAQFYANQCQELGSATSATAKPERLTLSNVAAGNYTLLIGNLGVGNESGTFQIFVTR